MTDTALRGQEEPHGTVTALPVDENGAGSGLDAAAAIRAFNAAHEAHEELSMRAYQAARAADHGADQVRQAEVTASATRAGHLATQAERPQRHAPRGRQLVIAGVTVALDAVACYFAAQALGGGQADTLVWTGLFLAVLGGAEAALGLSADRRRPSWRWLAAATGLFITGLGLLRWSYLVTVGIGGVTALTGAALFTAATVGFVTLGYRALRVAETPQTARARRRARKAARELAAARARAARYQADRDRLADAYLSRIRGSLLAHGPASELRRLEAAVRAHLLGEEQ